MRYRMLILAGILCFAAAGSLYSYGTTYAEYPSEAQTVTPTANLPTPTATGVLDSALVDRYTKVGELEPPLPIPPLAEIAPTGDVQDVVSYYQSHTDELAELFGDEERASAFFAMYIVHLAKPYGVAPSVETLPEFMALTFAHCGDYAPVQQEINQALGLTTRYIAFTNGFHGWTEVQIDGNWEIFDSTTNVWINQPMEALLQGVPRSYRMFYSPALDRTAPDIYRAHLQEGYNAPALRARLPYFGLEWGVVYPPLVQYSDED